MNIASVAILVLELAFVALAALTLFRFRETIGLGPLYIFVGTNQFLSVVLAASVYLSVAPGVVVSPGSSVLFTSSLFVILLVYLGTDIPTTRGLIFGIFIANVTMTALLWFTAFEMQSLEVLNPLQLPVELFTVSPPVFVFGTIVLLADVLLVVTVFQWLRLRRPSGSLLGHILATLTVALIFDAVLFSALLAGALPYADVLRGQLLGKLPAGWMFGVFLYGYLCRYEPQIATPPRAVGGHVDDVFSIFTYRERYREIRERLVVAEAASVAKSRFLANMSHELRTPLNAIIGFTSVMLQRRESVDDQHRMLLGRVWANGMHLLELINGLLDLSKIESGRNELNVENCDLGELVGETLEQLQPQVAGKPIEVRSYIPHTPIMVETDRMRLKQVLINLVGNAFKYTNEGEVNVRLVADERTGRAARIDVTDTGIGIAAEKTERIFEPFFHEDSAIRNEPGVGLGLAIARALCEQMGYELLVDSEPGRGSTFSILFVETATRDARSSAVA